MTKDEQKDIIFDALLKIAVSDAMKNEMDALPTNEELNTVYIPSTELNQRIAKMIHQGMKKSKHKRYSKKMRKLAAGIVIIFALSSITVLSVEATRTVILNTIVEQFSQYTEIKFEESDSEKQADIYRPTYLPEGYEEVSMHTSGSTVVLIYSDKTDNEISFIQRPAVEGTALVDNERNEYLELEIAGNKAYLFEANKGRIVNVLLWKVEGTGFELFSQISTEELIKIANSVTK